MKPVPKNRRPNASGLETLEKLRPDLEAGFNDAEIGRKHGVSKQVVKYWRRYLRLPSARTGRRVRLGALPEMERKLAAAIRLRDKLSRRVEALETAIARMRETEAVQIAETASAEVAPAPKAPKEGPDA